MQALPILYVAPLLLPTVHTQPFDSRCRSKISPGANCRPSTVGPAFSHSPELVQLLEAYQCRWTIALSPEEVGRPNRARLALHAATHYPVAHIPRTRHAATHYPLARLTPNTARRYALPGGTPNPTHGVSQELLVVVRGVDVELRRAVDGLDRPGTVVRGVIPADRFPEWQRITWLPDSSAFIVAGGQGRFTVVGAQTGAAWYTIDTMYSDWNHPSHAEVHAAVAGQAAVAEPRFAGRLFALTYAGRLQSYVLDRSSYTVSSHVDTTPFFEAVGALAHVAAHNLLVVGGSGRGGGGGSQGGGAACLHAWRITSEPPHLAAVDLQTAGPGDTLPLPSGCIHALAVSPSGHRLVALDVTGRLAVHHLPSLRLEREWDNAVVTAVCSGGALSWMPTAGAQRTALAVAWWSDDDVIITHSNGHVTVADAATLTARLEASVQMQPTMCITRGQAATLGSVGSGEEVGLRKCHVLECERKLSDIATRAEDNPIATLRNAANRAVYALTGSEHFLPAVPQTVKETFRLTCLQSTTPEL